MNTMSRNFSTALLLLAVYVLAISHVEGQQRTCYFDPPPKPATAQPGPYQWLRDAVKEMKKNCPSKCKAPDPCANNPCQNEGICQSDGKSFNCTCINDYLGPTCENQDPCQVNPCQHNGTCHPFDDGSNYMCDCEVGTFGLHCENYVRLVGGNGPHEGRVEVFYQGSLGTVCHDNWDLNDGDVICRQLGYPAATHVFDKAFFGEGSGSILLNDVACTGSESSIDECSHAGWSQSNCAHSEDAGVTCGDLANVASSCRAYVDVGKYGLFKSSYRLPCDPSAVVNAWCDDSRKFMYFINLNEKCSAGQWNRDNICPEKIHKIRIANQVDDVWTSWILDESSCGSFTFNLDFMIDVFHCRTPVTSGWQWGSTGILAEANCSSSGDWYRGTFAQCAPSPYVNVTVSLDFGPSTYGQYILSCHDGSDWLQLDSLSTAVGYLHFYVED